MREGAGDRPVRADGAGTERLGGPPSDHGTALTPGALRALRAAPRRRAVALVLAVVVGLALSWVHWLGLFAAGALVGLASATLPRALVAGLLVGVLAVVLNVLLVPAMGVGEFVGLAPASYVTVGVGLLAPPWGSLLRGVL